MIVVVLDALQGHVGSAAGTRVLSMEQHMISHAVHAGIY